MASPDTVRRTRDALRSLLPPGMLWRRRGGALDHLLEGLASEFAEVAERVEVLLDDGFPARAFELLADWERTVGVPNDCIPELPATIEGRRELVVQRLNPPTGQSLEFYRLLALALGYTVTLHEFRPFQAGPSTGDPMGNGSSSRAGDALTNGAWIHTFAVDAPGETVRTFKAGSLAGEALATWGNAVLECAFAAAKPAHAIVLHRYGADAVPPRQPVAYGKKGQFGPCWFVDHDWTHALLDTANTLLAVDAGITPPAESHAGRSYVLGSGGSSSEGAEYVFEVGEILTTPQRHEVTLYVREGSAPAFVLALYNANRLSLAPDELLGTGRFTWTLGALAFDGSPFDGSALDLGGGWWRARWSVLSDAGDVGPARLLGVRVPDAAPWASRTLTVASGTVCALIAATPP